MKIIKIKIPRQQKNKIIDPYEVMQQIDNIDIKNHETNSKRIWTPERIREELAKTIQVLR